MLVILTITAGNHCRRLDKNVSLLAQNSIKQYKNGIKTAETERNNRECINAP